MGMSLLVTYILLVAASFIAAFVSGAAGFGGALMLLPILVLCVGSEVAVPVLTIAQLIGNLSRMMFGFKQIKWKPVGLFLMTALPLSALGAFGFAVIPKDLVTRLIGGALVVMVVLKYYRLIKFEANSKALVLGGAVTGLLSGLAGSAGPIGAAVFLSLGLPPISYIASEATTATAMHILKTIIYGNLVTIPTRAILLGLVMGGAMIVGTYCAKRLIQNMSKDKFQQIVFGLLLIVGLVMMIFGA
jgi:uncharacterized protein